MAFLLFERIEERVSFILRPTGESFSLAGYNLIYKAWGKRGSPTDQGWHVTADEFIQLQSAGEHSHATRRLIIDFHPSAKQRIGLIELLDVYAYTHGNDLGGPSWTPLMLRMRDVFYEEYDREIAMEEKSEIIHSIPEPPDGDDFVEFLYLNGPDNGWNWGRNGMVNAAFLQGDARTYFRNFF